MQPELIFFHGFMGRSSDWNDIRGRLHQSDAKIGTSAVDIQSAENWESGIDGLAAGISHGSILVGYSMGARIALGLAVKYPQTIGGVVLISGNPGLESVDARRQRLAADLRLADQIDKLSDRASVEQFLNQWYQQSVFAGVPESVKSEEIRCKANFDCRIWPDLLRTFSVARQPDFWPHLKKLSIPFCVVAGETDEKYNRIAARMGREATSRVSIQIVPNSGHIVHREQPDRLVQIVQDFLSGVR